MPAQSAAPSPQNPPLQASRDRVTKRGLFPAIPAQSPAAPRYEAITLSPEATLYSFTIIHPNPKSGEKPFVLVYADFAEDVRVFGKLELPEGIAPRIGMRLRTVIGDAGAYHFQPAQEQTP